MSRARVETAGGRRKLSEEHRAKLSAAARRQWDGMDPAAREAALARIGRKGKPAGGPLTEGSTLSGSGKPGSDPPEGRRSPLAMTPLELIRSLRGRG